MFKNKDNKKLIIFEHNELSHLIQCVFNKNKKK